MTRIQLMTAIECGNNQTLNKFLKTGNFVLLNSKNQIEKLLFSEVKLKKLYKKYKENVIFERDKNLIKQGLKGRKKTRLEINS